LPLYLLQKKRPNFVLRLSKTQQNQDAFMQYTESQLLVQLAKCWNNLDVSFIENHLADDITYESQWVFTPIKGKANFWPYLKSKFQAIKTAVQQGKMQVSAELAIHPSLPGKQCLVLTQTTSLEDVSVLIVIELLDDLISRIDICFIPEPDDAILSGIQPK
jgi:hypothetical protein